MAPFLFGLVHGGGNGGLRWPRAMRVRGEGLMEEFCVSRYIGVKEGMERLYVRSCLWSG